RARQLASGARALRRTHSPEAFFRAVVAGASRQIPDLTLEQLAGKTEIMSTSEVIESAFTRSGWNDYVSDKFANVETMVREDNQIITLAGEAPAQTLPRRDDLIALYAESFPTAWAEFLETIRMRTQADCESARDDYKTLKASRNSPILHLFR